MPATVTQPLRDEHRELMPHIEELRATADLVGFATHDELRDAVARSVEFLSRHLMPHALAEDRALYPVVARALGAPGATKTMSRDHVAVADLTADLVQLYERLKWERPSPVQERELRRALYGLYALVKTHFAKEEEIFLPLLDERLTSDEAATMFDEMERAAGEAKAQA